MNVHKSTVLALGAALSTVFAGAASLPDPVGGVITIDISSDVTYDVELPAATKLVKKGSGTATLTVASPDFSGADGVFVEGGTLAITDYGAVGPTADVTVSAGATFLIAAPCMSATDVGYFGSSAAHHVTISGAGASGRAGALCFQPSGTGDGGQNVLSHLTLSGDATISGTKRWGARDLLQLNGKTLTVANANGTKDSPTTFILTLTKMYPGHIVIGDGSGIATQQGTTFDATCTAANSSIVVRPNGTLTHHYCPNPLPHTVIVEVDTATDTYGKLRAEEATGTRYRNIYAGPILSRPARTRRFEVAVGGTTSMETCRMFWTGNSVISNQFRKTGLGTLVVSGGLEMLGDADAQRLQVDRGMIEFTAGAVVTNVAFALFSSSAASGAIFGGGDLSFTKIDTGYGTGMQTRPIRQTNGTVRVVAGTNHEIYIGHNASDYNMGSYYLEGGTLAHQGVRVTGLTTAVPTSPESSSRGVFVQRGGMMSRSGGSINIGTYGTGVWRQTGGTNDNNAASFGENNNVGTRTTSHATLEVEGSNTLYSTGLVRWGSKNATGRIVLSVHDGATFALHALMYGNNDTTRSCDASLYFNGGILKALRTAVISGSTLTPDGLFIGKDGLVVDTSDCRDVSGSTRGKIGECKFDLNLRALTGKGLSSVTLPDTAEFKALVYNGPAIIDIEGTGAGAAAYADWDFENCCLVPHVSAPGYGLDADGTKVYVRSPNGKVRYECAFTLADAPTESAGLAKRGEGTLKLTAANSYLGLTRIESGTLSMVHPNGIPATSGVILARGTQLHLGTNVLTTTAIGGQGTVWGDTSSVSEAGSVNLAAGGTIYVTATELFSENWQPLVFANLLTAGSGVTVVVTDPENLPEAGRHTVTILQANAGLTFAEAPTIAIEGARLSVQGKKLILTYKKRAGLMLLCK